jgi:hypothetical protein
MAASSPPLLLWRSSAEVRLRWEEPPREHCCPGKGLLTVPSCKVQLDTVGGLSQLQQQHRAPEVRESPPRQSQALCFPAVRQLLRSPASVSAAAEASLSRPDSPLWVRAAPGCGELGTVHGAIRGVVQCALLPRACPHCASDLQDAHRAAKSIGKSLERCAASAASAAPAAPAATTSAQPSTLLCPECRELVQPGPHIELLLRVAPAPAPAESGAGAAPGQPQPPAQAAAELHVHVPSVVATRLLAGSSLGALASLAAKRRSGDGAAAHEAKLASAAERQLLGKQLRVRCLVAWSGPESDALVTSICALHEDGAVLMSS